jgi:hypothetical protein
MVDGMLKITYKNKEIIYLDYSKFGDSKEKVLGLLKSAPDEYKKYPPKSLLVLVNVKGFHFDMDTLNTFKNEAPKTAPYEKKVAVVYVKGLVKAAYNFVALTKSNFKVFETEEEAKEWLIKD